MLAMRKTTLRLSLATLIIAGIAACSGGGNSASTAVPQAVVTSPSNAGLSASSTGLKLSLMITRGNKRVSKATARKHAQYVSYNTNGLQVTIVAGNTTKVYNFDVDTSAAYCQSTSNNSYGCTFAFPTLGPSETVTILELDQQPSPAGDPTTGLSTGAFPANTNVLAQGSTGQTPVTLTPGAVSQIAIALNPVIASFYDCEFFTTTSYFAQDSGTNNSTRVVVSGNMGRQRHSRADSGGCRRIYAL